MAASDLCQLSAVDLARAVRDGVASARDVLEAHLQRIARINPAVNAIVTLDEEWARATALAADEAQARGAALGPLHGLPVAHKDLQPTRGMRTTFGSPVYRDFIPNEDSLVVERIKAAGAITVGKTNTPEFGAGSQTFNPVFGATLNPFDLSRTCGGSSGGAAVALACGMLPIADGSDMGGSLRNPASFCNVVGLRPSPGRVPVWPAKLAWSTLGVEGPMARSVEDLALFLSAMAGPDPRSPIALPDPGVGFAKPLGRDVRGVRVAWWRDLGGLPVDPRVRAVVNRQRAVFEAMGCVIDEAEPDLSLADPVFKTLRAFAYVAGFADLVAEHRSLVKDTVIGEVERGLRLTTADVAHAERQRTELFHRTRLFLQRYEFFVLPTVQVPPFDVRDPWVTEIDGQQMETYIDWMKSCYLISALGLPAISVPAGFTDEGWPVGLQIVGRPQDDWGVLQIAHAYEMACGGERRWPPIDCAASEGL